MRVYITLPDGFVEKLRRIQVEKGYLTLTEFIRSVLIEYLSEYERGVKNDAS